MPAGVSWPQYLRFLAAASVATVFGAQVVHAVYKPLEDMDELVKKEIERLRTERAMLKEQGTDQLRYEGAKLKEQL